ncbi:hypothetical protein K438DRAFT_289331 [Mycena galopus ATCC 62051]|nr:hypothetical protein K438DRAFT_289331 [Mycena galopus ATCC 62051]
MLLLLLPTPSLTAATARTNKLIKRPSRCLAPALPRFNLCPHFPALRSVISDPRDNLRRVAAHLSSHWPHNTTRGMLYLQPTTQERIAFCSTQDESKTNPPSIARRTHVCTNLLRRPTIRLDSLDIRCDYFPTLSTLCETFCEGDYPREAHDSRKSISAPGQGRLRFLWS